MDDIGHPVELVRKDPHERYLNQKYFYRIKREDIL